MFAISPVSCISKTILRLRSVTLISTVCALYCAWAANPHLISSMSVPCRAEQGAGITAGPSKSYNCTDGVMEGRAAPHPAGRPPAPGTAPAPPGLFGQSGAATPPGQVGSGRLPAGQQLHVAPPPGSGAALPGQGPGAAPGHAGHAEDHLDPGGPRRSGRANIGQRPARYGDRPANETLRLLQAGQHGGAHHPQQGGGGHAPDSEAAREARAAAAQERDQLLLTIRRLSGGGQSGGGQPQGGSPAHPASPALSDGVQQEAQPRLNQTVPGNIAAASTPAGTAVLHLGAFGSTAPRHGADLRRRLFEPAGRQAGAHPGRVGNPRPIDRPGNLGQPARPAVREPGGRAGEAGHGGQENPARQDRQERQQQQQQQQQQQEHAAPALGAGLPPPGPPGPPVDGGQEAAPAGPAAEPPGPDPPPLPDMGAQAAGLLLKQVMLMAPRILEPWAANPRRMSCKWYTTGRLLPAGQGEQHSDFLRQMLPALPPDKYEWLSGDPEGFRHLTSLARTAFDQRSPLHLSAAVLDEIRVECTIPALDVVNQWITAFTGGTMERLAETYLDLYTRLNEVPLYLMEKAKRGQRFMHALEQYSANAHELQLAAFQVNMRHAEPAAAAEICTAHYGLMSELVHRRNAFATYSIIDQIMEFEQDRISQVAATQRAEQAMQCWNTPVQPGDRPILLLGHDAVNNVTAQLHFTKPVETFLSGIAEVDWNRDAEAINSIVAAARRLEDQQQREQHNGPPHQPDGHFGQQPHHYGGRQGQDRPGPVPVETLEDHLKSRVLKFTAQVIGPLVGYEYPNAVYLTDVIHDTAEVEALEKKSKNIMLALEKFAGTHGYIPEVADMMYGGVESVVFRPATDIISGLDAKLLRASNDCREAERKMREDEKRVRDSLGKVELPDLTKASDTFTWHRSYTKLEDRFHSEQERFTTIKKAVKEPKIAEEIKAFHTSDQVLKWIVNRYMDNRAARDWLIGPLLNMTPAHNARMMAENVAALQAAYTTIEHFDFKNQVGEVELRNIEARVLYGAYAVAYREAADENLVNLGLVPTDENVDYSRADQMDALVRGSMNPATVLVEFEFLASYTKKKQRAYQLAATSEAQMASERAARKQAAAARQPQHSGRGSGNTGGRTGSQSTFKTEADSKPLNAKAPCPVCEPGKNCKVKFGSAAFCLVFKRSPHKRKWDLVDIKQLCAKCCSSKARCSSRPPCPIDRCRRCGGPHHSILCREADGPTASKTFHTGGSNGEPDDDEEEKLNEEFRRCMHASQEESEAAQAEGEEDDGDAGGKE